VAGFPTSTPILLAVLTATGVEPFSRWDLTGLLLGELCCTSAPLLDSSDWATLEVLERASGCPPALFRNGLQSATGEALAVVSFYNKLTSAMPSFDITRRLEVEGD